MLDLLLLQVLAQGPGSVTRTVTPPGSPLFWVFVLFSVGLTIGGAVVVARDLKGRAAARHEEQGRLAEQGRAHQASALSSLGARDDDEALELRAEAEAAAEGLEAAAKLVAGPASLAQLRALVAELESVAEQAEGR